MSDKKISKKVIAERAAQAAGQSVRLEHHYRHNHVLEAARYRLDNGLTIVLMRDPRAPVFAYQTWFKVGSRDEDPTRTGMAHLFEHLMFKGTTHHPIGELDREMERRGSETNAATWVDWTYYCEALAARDDNLEAVVDFEVDRMVNLVLDRETFASELEVVKNERRMAVDDSVGGTLNELLFARAYQRHPYRWTTIGSMAHLEAATLDELRAFYRSYYAPNNAVVIVVGDVDEVEALALLARRYGPLEAQPIERPAREPEPPQAEARFERIEKPVAAPQVIIGFHAPAQLDDDFATLEILNEALVSGDSARLYRRLVVEDQIATDVGGYVSPFSDPGLYELFVTARAGVSPERIIEVIQEELDRLPDGLEPFELNKARNGLELAFLDSLKDAEGCAEALGHYECNYGDFSLAFNWAGRWQRVSADQLARVARERLRSSNRTAIVAEGSAR